MPKSAHRGAIQQGAVRLVWETGKPIAQVARELGVNDVLKRSVVLWVNDAMGR